jgi:hypothetical protein
LVLLVPAAELISSRAAIEKFVGTCAVHKNFAVRLYVRKGVVAVVFCALFIQRGREKSAKGAYLEISASSKH